MSDTVQFPLMVRTDGEEFVINKEDEITSPNYPLDYDGDRGRSKRRRRCGQCGPCQVKENCNKCNFCQRRDVLKQTCIYRKCVYLRSKPKPYQHGSGGVDSNHVTSPPNQQSCSVPTATATSDRPRSCSASINNASPHPSGGIFNPFNPLNSTNEQTKLSNGPSPFSPSISSTGPMSFTPVSSCSSVTPISSSSGPTFTPGESLFRPPVPQLSQQPSVIVSSPDNTLPQMPPYPQNMPHSGHSSMPVLPCVNDMIFTRPSQENSSFSNPLSHHTLQNDSLKYDSYFGRYGHQPSEPRNNLPSPCMYHPGFVSPYGSAGSTDRGPYHGYIRPPAFPPYIPSNTNMLRHIPSLPQRYPMPPPPPTGRYGQGYTDPTGYNRLQPSHDMSNMSHHHPFTSFGGFNRHQPTQYEQSSMCPKNVFGPPAFLSLALGTLRVQERPQGFHNSKCNPNPFFYPWEKHLSPNSNPHENINTHLLPWERNYFHPIRRPNSAFSDDASKQSSASSGFECDVISIDNVEMNAFIRSDGCNSIEIEVEDPSTPNDKKLLTEMYSDAKSRFDTDINCNYKTKPESPKKITLSGVVTLKQDLGDEGVIQLEIPGNKVTLEDSILDSTLAKYSCNVEDLLKFIDSEPRNLLESQNEVEYTCT